ncbi:MAG: phosphoenolpyruvate--protein phosphotransferase [Candidatus Omnitrophica bacterium]|nr:phosphoenolpyruvate--protein phosphotransferase [Candidatus Omnitrophota bacterium]
MNPEETLKGIPASAGVTIGRPFFLDSEGFSVQRQEIAEEEVAGEIARFEDALIQTRAEILRIQKKILEEMGKEQGEIFSAHLLVIEDRTLIEEVITRVKAEKVVVDYIFLDVLKRYIHAFSKIEDEYIRERTSDIEDVGKRVLRTLLGKQRQTLQDLKEPVIVVAYDLSPSDTALMHRENVKGFVTDIGGRTSHTAIMAKSLEIPAVVGLEEVTQRVSKDDLLIIDGAQGLVIINPTEETIRRYTEEQKRLEEFGRSLLKLKDLPAETLDGHRVTLAANIEFPHEIPSVIAHGAEGIGLYRTEYFYMNRVDLPTEEEHFESYHKVVQEVQPHSVIVRTLDLGGDKFLSQLDIPNEMNPFLGWRAIRFCLARPDIFKVQLRAILRASAKGKMKVMYPMISGVEELRQANALFREVKEELRREKIPFDEKIEVGAMIEIPSAALTCDLLAKEVHFFSIGTNDLIQYALAVDRSNEKIAYLYEPAHPAVLRLVKHIIDTAHKHHLWVGMCGEMAGDPRLALILLGLGLDGFSTSAVNLPEIKRVIRSVKMGEAKKIAEEALSLSTGREVEAYLEKMTKKIFMGEP